MADALSTKVRCVVVTPEKTVLDETADFVAVPVFDGELGIMLNHAPMVARLGPGELRLTSHGVSKRLFVDGGFGQVNDNVVTILTPRAKKADELDASKLQKELETVNAEVPASEEALAEKAHRIERTRAQLRVVSK